MTLDTDHLQQAIRYAERHNQLTVTVKDGNREVRLPLDLARVFLNQTIRRSYA